MIAKKDSTEISQSKKRKSKKISKRKSFVPQNTQHFGQHSFRRRTYNRRKICCDGKLINNRVSKFCNEFIELRTEKGNVGKTDGAYIANLKCYFRFFKKRSGKKATKNIYALTNIGNLLTTQVVIFGSAIGACLWNFYKKFIQT